MKIGDIFRYKGGQAVLDGCIGVVLSKPNQYGQYRVRVAHKQLYILSQSMGEL